MFKRVFCVVMTLVSGACLQSPAQATIVVSAVETITGGTTSKTVTIDISTITSGIVTPPPLPPGPIDPSFEQVGYYHFRVNLTGVGISGLSAAYNSASVFGGLAAVDLDAAAGVNPGISGTQVTFKAGSTTNIGIPTTGNNFVGSVSFTTTLNGNFNFSITPLDTSSGGGLASQNTTPGVGTGFARNGALAGSFSVIDQDLQPKVISVSGIVAVPEPSSILLIGSAVAGFGVYRMRRLNKVPKT